MHSSSAPGVLARPRGIVHPPVKGPELEVDVGVPVQADAAGGLPRSEEKHSASLWRFGFWRQSIAR